MQNRGSKKLGFMQFGEFYKRLIRNGVEITMQKLDIKINDNKEKYLEYKGTVLAYEHTQKEQYGEYDVVDMSPAARAGFTQRADIFNIGAFTAQVISDSDNQANDISFYAEDIDEAHFKVIMTYYYPRGGHQEQEVGVVEVSCVD